MASMDAEKQPRLLVIWGKYDLSFDLGEPERYRKDIPKAEVATYSTPATLPGHKLRMNRRIGGGFVPAIL